VVVGRSTEQEFDKLRILVGCDTKHQIRLLSSSYPTNYHHGSVARKLALELEYSTILYYTILISFRSWT
jgi:hypothetical protein